eukprot:COSAG06_NODE_3015_length_5959_cov_59.427645_7_plen_126_part_00
MPGTNIRRVEKKKGAFLFRRNIVGTTSEGLGIYAYHSCINHSSDPNAGKKTSPLHRFMPKVIALPRQARDKHRESTQERGRFLAVVTGDMNVQGAHVLVVAQRDIAAVRTKTRLLCKCQLILKNE